MAEEFYISGLDELQKNLEKFSQKIQGNAMRQALNAGAGVFADSARNFAPVGAPSDENKQLYGAYTGLLKDSIHVNTYLKDGAAKAVVVAGGKNAYYAHMVEFGTAQHFIASKSGKALTFDGKFYANVTHPGATKHPFMRPAFDSAGQGAIEAVAAYLRTRIESENTKLDQ